MITRRRFIGTLGSSTLLGSVGAAAGAMAANLNAEQRAPDGVAAAQEAIELPPWSPAAPSGQPFHFDVSPTHPPRKSMWRPAGPPRRFFAERLPATFERTLVIEELKLPQGSLAWIFTGELGGFTLSTTSGKVRVLERCRVGGGALARWPPSAAQTARTVFPYAAFTKTACEQMQSKELVRLG
jgi:hypothetical protein